MSIKLFAPSAAWDGMLQGLHGFGRLPAAASGVCKRREELGNIKTRMIGTGSYVPDFILTNEMLEQMVDTSDEWIVKRTGIRERHIGRGMHTWELGLRAAQAALRDADISAQAVDLILLTTCSPDFYSPIHASVIQEHLGAANAACVDLNACCTGFIYATDVADAYIRSGKARTVLVVSAETLSRITDYTDRSTCVLFGDAAGAVVYQACEEDTAGGILSCDVASDGSGWNYLYMEGLPLEQDPLSGDRSFDPTARFLKMQGSQVVRFTAKAVPETMERALRKAGISAEEIDWVVPHQANLRILKVIADRFHLPEDKIYVNLDRYGNTSSASIPLCLDEMRRKGLLKSGQKVICAGFGGGLTYGAFILQIG